jgi:hypothetical protein
MANRLPIGLFLYSFPDKNGMSSTARTMPALDPAQLPASSMVFH